MIPQSYTLSAYSYLLLYRLREGLCNKKARFQESRFFEYSIAHLTLIAARKRHNARDVLSAILIHFLVYQMNASAYFNRRSPRGERLTKEQFEGFLWGFQSMLPVGGATARVGKLFRLIIISIHAPRGGSDCTVKACSNDRIKRSTLREPHFLYSKNACFSPIFPLCATTSRTKNQRIIVSFGSYPGLAPMCFTLDWYRFPRL